MCERFTLFRSSFDAMKAMPPEILKEIFIMYGQYALDDILPDVNDGIAYGLFCSMKPLIDASKKKQAAGKSRGEVSKQEANGSKQEAEESNPEAKIKDKSIKSKDKNIKDISGRFIPPTLAEVQEYISSQGYNIDAERFINFYESKGWMVGKNKMKDWKAAVRTWSRSQREEKTAEGKRQEVTANRFNNFRQREYDYEELEKQLLSAQWGT